MKFSRHKYWSGLPFPSPGDLPDPGMKLRFPSLQANSLSSEPQGKPHFLCLRILKNEEFVLHGRNNEKSDKKVMFILTFSMVEKMMKRIAGNKNGNKYTASLRLFSIKELVVHQRWRY